MQRHDGVTVHCVVRIAELERRLVILPPTSFFTYYTQQGARMGDLCSYCSYRSYCSYYH